jgi:transcriptional regulator with XRE-family HTH domain
VNVRDPIRERGERLRSLRRALNITVRDVEKYSRRIADLTGKKDCIVSRTSLSAAEKSGKLSPNINWLISLTIIYRVNLSELLLISGLDPDEITKLQKQIQLPRTSLISPALYDVNRTIRFPLKFDPHIDLRESVVLSHFVQTWGEIPVGFIHELTIHKHLYGIIGTEDFTLHPFIPPGSFVQIDTRDTTIQTSGWQTDFDRPIYFFQLRAGYACGWCETADGVLSIIPFSAAHRPPKKFRYPQEIEVIGRVTGMAVSLVPFARRVGTKNQAKGS